jgi:thiol-disulfide isomerase/thioredoxin
MHKTLIVFLVILSTFYAVASDLEGRFPKNLIIHDKPISYKNIFFYDQKSEKVELSNFKKKLYVIYFFASWCGDCIDEIIQLEALEKKIGNQNFQVVPISEDYKARHEVVDDLIGKFKLETRIFFDDKNEVYKELNIKTIPSSIIITNGYEEIARITGRGSWDALYMQGVISKYLDKVN